MATIQEAMSNSAALLAGAISGSVQPSVLKEEIKDLLSSPLGARGFMAALALQELPKDKDVLAALLEGIKAGKEQSYELIIKNIIMSGCTAREHKKNNRQNEATLAKATSENSLKLVQLLQDKELAQLAGRALASIQSWPPDSPRRTEAKTNTNTDIEYWHTFFERWGYGKDQLSEIEPLLKAAAEMP